MSIPILMYHQIDEPPPSGTPLRGLVVSPSAFARQMRLLRLFGYRGMSMRELEPYLIGAKQGKVVGITFDDGYQNNLDNALPVLRRIGFTATCYGVSSMLAGYNSWDRDTGIAEKPLMTIQNWRAWLDAGMEAGSHTRTHADLTKLQPEDALQEIRESKRELEVALACEVRHFCYPYGRFTESHRNMVQQSGYVSATTTQRGRVHTLDDDTFALRRVLVARATTLFHLALKVGTAYEDRRR